LLINWLALKELLPKSYDGVAELNVVSTTFFIIVPISERFADGSDFRERLGCKGSGHRRELSRCSRKRQKSLDPKGNEPPKARYSEAGFCVQKVRSLEKTMKNELKIS